MREASLRSFPSLSSFPSHSAICHLKSSICHPLPRKVCRSSAAGTRRPLLNRRGSTISYRRYSFIPFEALESERTIFPCQQRQSLLREEQFAALPRFKSVLAQKQFQGAVLRILVWKTNQNHALLYSRWRAIGKSGES